MIWIWYEYHRIIPYYILLQYNTSPIPSWSYTSILPETPLWWKMPRVVRSQHYSVLSSRLDAHAHAHVDAHAHADAGSRPRPWQHNWLSRHRCSILTETYRDWFMTEPIDRQPFTLSTNIEGLAIIQAPLPMLLAFPRTRLRAPQIVTVINNDRQKYFIAEPPHGNSVRLLKQATAVDSSCPGCIEHSGFHEWPLVSWKYARDAGPACAGPSFKSPYKICFSNNCPRWRSFSSLVINTETPTGDSHRRLPPVSPHQVQWN